MEQGQGETPEIKAAGDKTVTKDEDKKTESKSCPACDGTSKDWGYNGYKCRACGTDHLLTTHYECSFMGGCASWKCYHCGKDDGEDWR